MEEMWFALPNRLTICLQTSAWFVSRLISKSIPPIYSRISLIFNMRVFEHWLVSVVYCLTAMTKWFCLMSAFGGLCGEVISRHFHNVVNFLLCMEDTRKTIGNRLMGRHGRLGIAMESNSKIIIGAYSSCVARIGKVGRTTKHIYLV